MLSRFLACFLVLWMAMAPAAIAAPAAAMSLQTGISAGHGGCDGCPDSSGDGNVCELLCLNAALFAMTVPAGKPAAVTGEQYDPVPLRTLSAHAVRPDPAPPRTA